MDPKWFKVDWYKISTWWVANFYITAYWDWTWIINWKEFNLKKWKIVKNFQLKEWENKIEMFYWPLSIYKTSINYESEAAKVARLKREKEEQEKKTAEYNKMVKEADEQLKKSEGVKNRIKNKIERDIKWMYNFEIRSYLLKRWFKQTDSWFEKAPDWSTQVKTYFKWEIEWRVVLFSIQSAYDLNSYYTDIEVQ